MQRANRLRKNGQFRYVYRRGKSIASGHIVLNYVRANRLLAGFSVSRKVGGAVVRNRVKRRMRENFRLRMDCLKKGYYVFTARASAAQADFQTIARDMERALRKMKLYREEQ